MTTSDENELHRLAAMLETIDRSLEHTSPPREALKKAGIALSLGFIRELRSDIERQFEQLGTPLTDAERTRLHSTGIEPVGMKGSWLTIDTKKLTIFLHQLKSQACLGHILLLPC